MKYLDSFLLLPHCTLFTIKIGFLKKLCKIAKNGLKLSFQKQNPLPPSINPAEIKFDFLTRPVIIISKVG